MSGDPHVFLAIVANMAYATLDNLALDNAFAILIGPGQNVMSVANDGKATIVTFAKRVIPTNLDAIDAPEVMTGQNVIIVRQDGNHGNTRHSYFQKPYPQTTKDIYATNACPITGDTTVKSVP